MNVARARVKTPRSGLTSVAALRDPWPRYAIRAARSVAALRDPRRAMRDSGGCDVSESTLVESVLDVASDPHRLHCKVFSPLQTPIARLLILHGYGDHAGRYARVMKHLALHRIACITVDQRGHGRSPGRRGYVRAWDEYLLDLRALLDATAADGIEPRSNHPPPPRFILGHSHGALVVATAYERGLLEADHLAGCILSSPYFGTKMRTPAYKHVLARITNHLVPWLAVSKGLKAQWLTTDDTLAAEDAADPLMNRVATPRWFFTMLGARARVIDQASRFKPPMLTVIGGRDIIADPAVAADFFERCASKDKSIYDYPSGVHELLRDQCREQVFQAITHWITARAGSNW